MAANMMMMLGITERGKARPLQAAGAGAGEITTTKAPTKPSELAMTLDVDLVIENSSKDTGLDPPKAREFSFTRESDLSEWVGSVLNTSGSKTERGRGGKQPTKKVTEDAPLTARARSSGLTETVLTKSEWARMLYKGAPKLPKTLSRPLERHSTESSYIPTLRENSAQREQETRANVMIKNSQRVVKRGAADSNKLAALTKAAAGGHAAGDTCDDGSDDGDGVGEEKAERGKAVASLETFLKISSAKLDIIKNAFIQAGGTLGQTDFVTTLMTAMPNDVGMEESQLVAQLFELFNQIDVMGENAVSWEELISYMIECQRVMAGDHIGSENILVYNPSTVIDRENRGTDVVIEKIIYFQELDQLAVCERGCSVLKLYKGSNLELVTTIVGHNGQVLTALHIEDLDYIVTSASDGCLMFWGAYTNNLRERIPCATAQMALAWDAKWQHLYSSSAQTGAITQWDIKTMSPIKELIGHTDSVMEIIIVPGMDAIFSASLDATIRLWDMGSGQHRRTLKGHTKGVYALAFIPNQRYVVSAGFDHELKVWNPLIDKVLYTLPHGNSIVGLCNVENTPRLLSASVDGILKMWDTRSFQRVWETTPVDDRESETTALHCIAYMPARDRVLVGGKRLYLFDYEQPVEPSLADEHPVLAARYLSSTCSVITAAGKSVKLWDARTGKMYCEFNGVASSDITAMCVDDRQRKFVLGESNGRVRIYNVQNGAMMKELDAHQSDVSAVLYCGLTKCVVTSGWDRVVKVQQDAPAERGTLLRWMKGHGNDITCTAFSVQLGLVASGSSDGLVRVWDYDEAKLDCTCSGHMSEITSLMFLPTLRCLVSCDFVGTIAFWLVRPWNTKGALVALFNNPCVSPRPDAPTHVAAMAVDANEENHMLYVGNEDGSINALSYAKIAEAADSTGKPTVRQREASKHYRHGRCVVPIPAGVEDRTLSSKDLAGSMKQLRFNKPTVPVAGAFFVQGQAAVKLKSSWRAHSDAVRSLQYVPDPECVLTAAFDCRVAFWTVTGEKLGELHQGVELMGHRWKLPIDVGARREQEAALRAQQKKLLESKHDGGVKTSGAGDSAAKDSTFLTTQSYL